LRRFPTSVTSRTGRTPIGQQGKFPAFSLAYPGPDFIPGAVSALKGASLSQHVRAWQTEQEFEQWWTHSQTVPHLTLGVSTRGPFF
jgi:hypothetical protein